MNGLRLLQRVIDQRRIDAEGEQHLVNALMRYHADPDADGVMLLRYLGLPTTSKKFRQATRDYWLCAASELIGGDTPPKRAHLLHDACRRFERVWPRWKSYTTAPEGADELSGCLHLARRSGEFPGERQLRNILSEAFEESNFPSPRPESNHPNSEG